MQAIRQLPACRLVELPKLDLQADSVLAGVEGLASAGGNHMQRRKAALDQSVDPAEQRRRMLLAARSQHLDRVEHKGDRPARLPNRVTDRSPQHFREY